ncbi:MAG: ATP-binding domain-containing protein, partial [Bdellovibrionales bacterium]|nr:ATP-binding domain-containing protein [Bdellovibrionales bacterium]
KFYDRKEIKDILSYLKLLMNPADNQSFLRVINTPPRGIGASTVQAIVNHARDTSSSLWDAAQALAAEQKKLLGFVELFRKLSSFSKTAELSELVWTVVELSGYLKRLETDKDPSAQGRIENLQELRAIAGSMQLPDQPAEALQMFLDRASLASSADEKDVVEGTDQSYVSLMTLHLAKGLEFPVVFFTGLEEGLSPHYLSLNDPTEMEEERRLCYVGITRAMQKLYLTHAERRGMFTQGDNPGTAYYRTPSRFLSDIPGTLVEIDPSSYYPSDIHYDEGLDPFSEQDWGAISKGQRQDEPKKISGKTMNIALGLHKKKAGVAALVASADTMIDDDSKRLPVDEICAGKKVLHPSFGTGTVELVEHDPKGNERKSKVHVFFDDIQGVRKLQLHKARLQAVS